MNIKIIAIMMTLGLLSACARNEANVVYPDFSDNTMDKSVKPQDDFYQYVNGNWMKNNPLPDDKSRFGSFDKLREDSRDKQKTILSEITQKQHPKGSLEQRIADFYNTGMDTATIEQLGYQPIASYLKQVEQIATKKDITEAVARFHEYQIGAIFHYYAYADYKDSKMTISHLAQGGLGLADKDYYLVKNKKNTEMLQEYSKHIVKMFQLIDYSEKDAKAMAKNIIDLETALAKVSMSKLDRRDPDNTYNFTKVEDLAKMSPVFDWAGYFQKRGVNIEKVNVAQPEFFKGISNIIKKFSITQWQHYFKWNILNETAAYLNKALVAQNFAFYGNYISGRKKNEDRWKRVLGVVNDNVGELLGQLYVQRYFPPKAKTEMKELVENLRKAFRVRINDLEWMTAETKQKALKKLNSFGVKIGYPDKWKAYKGLEITPKSYLGNVLSAKKVEAQENLDKIGKPVDLGEWYMSPQTVNAYYSPLKNEIVFPAAILQPPFFYLGADKAVNYGGIGVVIGHEMSHGFDDKGCKFDADGNLEMWWQKEDKTKFDGKTQVLVDQFNEIVVLKGENGEEDLHANGAYTLGENIADNGGLNISLDALRMAEKQNGVDADKDGFNSTQRFFLNYARIWAQNIRKKEIKRLTDIDVHALGEHRVNAQVLHLEEFHKQFGVTKKDPMYKKKEERALIW